MPIIHATITLAIKADVLPPDIPGDLGPEDGIMEPISGAEQVSYDIFKKIQEVLPENVYAFIQAVSVPT